MDMSDKPMESEGGSMDEYGDIDPGRFNEDGSFIGQYGKSSTNIDVWKVLLLSVFFAQSAKLSSSMLTLLCQAYMEGSLRCKNVESSWKAVSFPVVV